MQKFLRDEKNIPPYTSNTYIFIPPIYYSSEARPKAEQSLELGWKKKSEQKKKVRRLVPPILYLVKLFTFLSKFLPFSPFFNLQKLFLMFSTFIIYPKDILRKQFSQKSFSEKKKSKKIIHCFFSNFFFFRIFFFNQNLLNTFFFLFYCNSSFSNKKKDKKNASLDQYIVIVILLFLWTIFSNKLFFNSLRDIFLCFFS